MEEIIDLEEFLENLSIPDPEFAAVYDSETGKITCVGPLHAFAGEEYKVTIDKEVAIDILENRLPIDRCFIDPRTKKPIITEVRSLRKIDDILHRIVETKWANLEKIDLYVTYDQTKKMLQFQLAKELGGTKKNISQEMKNNILLSGETKMDFMITDYNDPNIEYECFSLTVSDLIKKTKTFKDVELPEKFSIYTCRLFENYALEIK